jgi:hypothetical protein
MENRFQPIIEVKTSEELLTMVYQFTEWDPEMLQAVENELQKRQQLPDDVAIRKQEIINNEHLELSKGKAASIGGQILGWLAVLGLIGLIIGYNYAYSKTRSKYTQKKYFTYDEDTRDNGRYIFYTGLAILVASFLYFFLKLAGRMI